MDQIKSLQETLARNILIVDDDPDTCTLLEILFRAKGYTTNVVYSGREALKCMDTDQPDAVVLDVMMPEMDGWETFTNMRSRSDIPVLFLTALTSGDCAARAFNLGGNDFMHKPFYPEELLARIGALLKNQQIKRLETVITDHERDIQAKLPLVSVVIPAYNEEAGLPLVLKALFGILDETYEVLVIDDGSSDNTANVAMAFPCRLIRHQFNRGKGAALRTGLQQARGKYVIFLDADNTYPVEMIPALARHLNDYDLVRGVRFSGRTNIPLLNRLGNLLFDGVIRLLHTVEGGDILSGMYGGRRDLLLELDLQSEGFDIEAEICVKAKARGLKCATLPITYAQRVGDKKLSAFYDGLRILYRVMQLAVSLSPLLIFVIPGISLFIFCLFGLCLVQLKQLHLVNLPLAMNGTFLLGAIGSLGVQLIVFGTAVYAAGMAYGLRGRANRTLDIISQLLSTRASMLVGSIIGMIGIIGITWMAVDWFIHRGPFNMTSMLVTMSVCLMLGFQLVSAGVFLSALKGLRRPTIDVVKQKAILRIPQYAKSRV